MVLDQNFSIFMSYLVATLLSFFLYRKKEAFILFHFFILGFLEFDSPIRAMEVFTKVSLFSSLFLIFFPIKELDYSRSSLKKIGTNVGVYILIPYLVSYWLTPEVHSLLTGNYADTNFRNLLVPLWSMVALFAILNLKSFSGKAFFSLLSSYSVITLILTAPVTLWFYLNTFRSFHRLRQVEFYLLKDFQGWFFLLNDGFGAPKIWFLVDALCGYLFLISFLVFLVNFIESGWRKKNVLWWESLLLSVSLILLIMWNYTTVLLAMVIFFILTSVFLFFLARLESETVLKRKSFMIKGLLVPFLSFFIIWIFVDRFNEENFRFNTLERKFSIRQDNFRSNGKWLSYIPKENETANNFSRIEKWYTQWENLKRVGVFKGIGYPKSLDEKYKWLDDIGLLSGHSKLFDDMMRLGLVSGILYNAVFWFPLCLLVFQLRRWRDLKFNHWLWLKWFFLFLGSLIVVTVGTWGELTLSLGLQLVLIGLYLLRLNPLNRFVGEKIF